MKIKSSEREHENRKGEHYHHNREQKHVGVPLA